MAFGKHKDEQDKKDNSLDLNDDGVVTEDEARANVKDYGVDPETVEDDTVWVHKTGEERTAEERVLGPAREHPDRGDLIEDRSDEIKRHNFKTPGDAKGELTAESNRFHPDEPEATS